MNIVTTIIITISSGLIGGYISYYFTEKSENYKFELLKKEQAAKIAELFALWVKYDDKALKEQSINDKNNYLEKLNKLTWEMVMWIQDENIVRQIMETLSHSSKLDIKQIILQIREIIQNKKSKVLKWEDLVNFKFRNSEFEEIIPSPSAPLEE